MGREEILQARALLPFLPSASGGGYPAFAAYKLLSPSSLFASEMEGDGKVLKGTANS